MAIPIQFLARFAVPLIVAALSSPDNAAEQALLYDRTMRETDRVLSIANKEGEGPTETYDYIIVGGGAAGAVVTKRLTEDPNVRVLLLELGGDPNPISEVPALQSAIFATDVMMARYKANHVDIGCKMFAGRCQFDRGIALGGSTTVNGMLYRRGHAKDYDSWANFTNDPIWAYSSVVDAFRAIETYGGAFAADGSPNYGTDGELYISTPEYRPGSELVEQALRAKGIPIVDMNSGENDWGFAPPDYNIRDGLRDGTYHGFIAPIVGRPNLKIYRYARVTKVVLDGNNRAIGVIYNRHGQNRYVAASREVILSAGAIDTPKILLLSGIGPRDHLDTIGIQTVVDLPSVGSTLQEHPGSAVPLEMSLDRVLGRSNLFTPETINDYLNGTGPLYNNPASSLGSSVHVMYGMFPSKTVNNPLYPEMQTFIDTAVVRSETGVPTQLISSSVGLMRTDQYGTVRLASADPEDHPLIDPKFFVDQPQELELIVDGIEFMIDFYMNNAVFQEAGIRWTSRPWGGVEVPECDHLNFPTRDYLRCYVRYTVRTTWHPTSSCRMAQTQQDGCVDSRLNVFGTSGLRIIDSSVMPFDITGNTMFPSIMIGEMGSRIILGRV